MDKNKNRATGEVRLRLALHYIQRFGNLNARQLGKLLCPNMPEHNARFTVSRMAQKAVNNGLLIERHADETNVRHWFIGLKGVRYLNENCDYDLPLKSGKEGKISSHRTACNDAIIELFTTYPDGTFWTDAEFYANPNNSWVVPVQSKNYGGHGKQPDGIFIRRDKVLWLEVENTKRGGKGMTELCNWLLKSLGNPHTITLNNQTDLQLDYVLMVSVSNATKPIGQRIEKWFKANHPLSDQIGRNITSRMKFMHLPTYAKTGLEAYLPSWRQVSEKSEPVCPPHQPPSPPPRKHYTNYADLLK